MAVLGVVSQSKEQCPVSRSPPGFVRAWMASTIFLGGVYKYSPFLAEIVCCFISVRLELRRESSNLLLHSSCCERCVGTYRAPIENIGMVMDVISYENLGLNREGRGRVVFCRSSLRLIIVSACLFFLDISVVKCCRFRSALAMCKQKHQCL